MTINALPNTNIIFSELMDLCATDKGTFYFSDQVVDSTTYRIFLYRLASYSDFLLPSALNCRGSVFAITDKDGVPLVTPVLVCRPNIKFFNLNENPFTMDLDLTDGNIARIDMKLDGSLISTYLHHGQLRVKSKGSLHSEQAVCAAQLIDSNTNNTMYLTLLALEVMGYTVNLEYTAPSNRIVVNYGRSELTILNAVHRDTGHVLHLDEYSTSQQMSADEIKLWVKVAYGFDPSYLLFSPSQLINQAPHLVDIEGFIVYLHSGQVFKLKTDWYLVQHRAKDNIDVPRKLFEAVIYETTDDLKSLFVDNPSVLQRIQAMEVRGQAIFNNLVHTVETFVSDHRHLVEDDKRKDFALLGQQLLPPHLFGLAMQRYVAIRDPSRKFVDYKEFCVKHWRDWGIEADPTPDTE